MIRVRQRKPYRTECVRTVLVLLLIYWVGLFSAFAQPGAQDEVQKGHQLAATICAVCHVAAADQRYPPIMKPPAPSFVSIAQRMDAEIANKIHS